jgi:prepilin-type N-terminal cleavage/methylation domain-containing protein/prepilin-type processing-associated H-X9-DG protein
MKRNQRSMTLHQAGRTGFTLTELLIVIMIIAILAAILFPSFSLLRQSGEATSCISNLRQIYTAATLYESENEGSLPLAFSRPPDPLMNFSGSPQEVWTDKLPPYLGMEPMGSNTNVIPTSRPSSVLICPTQFRLFPQIITYSMNHNLGGESMTPSKLQYPIKRSTVLAGESLPPRLRNDASTLPYFMDGWFWDSRGVYTVWRNMQHTTGGDKSFPHKGCANVCFLDGHVEATRLTGWLWKDVATKRPYVNGYGSPW